MAILASLEVEDDGTLKIRNFRDALTDLGERGSEAGRKLATIGRDVEPAKNALDGLSGTFERLAAATGLAYLTAQVVSFVKESLTAGARMEQLAGVAEYLGQQSGYSANNIKDLADKMQRTGITGRESYDALIQLTRANIDLSNATKLQAAAQNSASIAGLGSSETFATLIRGITTLQPELLRTAGFTTTLQQALRAHSEETGQSITTITGAQKQQILMNAVLREAEQLNGVYSLSMEYAAKQQGSLTRIIEQAQERIGTAFLPVITEVTKQMINWATAIRDADYSILAETMSGLAVILKEVASGFSALSNPLKTVLIDLSLLAIAIGPLLAMLGLAKTIFSGFFSLIGGGLSVFAGIAASVIAFTGNIGAAIALIAEGNGIIAVLGVTFTGVLAPIVAVSAVIAGLLIGVRALTGSWEFLTTPLSYAADLFTDIGAYLASTFGPAIAALNSFLEDTKWIVEGLAGVAFKNLSAEMEKWAGWAASAQTWFGDLFDKIGIGAASALASMDSFLKSIGLNTDDAIKDLTKLADIIMGTLGKAWDYVKGKLAEFRAAWASWALSFGDGSKQAFDAAEQGAKRLADTLDKDLKDRGYKPSVDAAALLSLGNKDLLAGVKSLDQETAGYVRGSAIELVKSHVMSKEEAKKAAAEAEKYAEAMDAMTQAGKTTAEIIDEMSGNTVEGIKWAREAGMEQGKIATAYGVTSTQVKAVGEQMKLSKMAMDAWKKVTDDSKNSNLMNLETLYAMDEIMAKGLNPNLTLINKTYDQFSVKVPVVVDGHKKIRDAIKDEVSATQQLDAMLDSLATGFQQMAQIAGDSFDDTAKAIGTTISAVQVGSKAADGLVTSWKGFGSNWKQTVDDVENGGTKVQTNWGGIAAAGIGAAANISGMVGAMQQATSHGTATANVLGGMAAGMKMGAQLAGPWGAAVGAAIGAIWGAFKGKPEWAKVQSDIQRDFGVHVSAELGKLIEAESKKTGNRVAAILNHLSEVVKEAGGITAKNVEAFTSKTRDLFSMVQTGAMKTEEATKQLNEVFPQLAKTVLEGTGLASKGFLELIALDEKFGTKSTEVATFVGQQLGAAMKGLQTFMSSAVIGSQVTADAVASSISKTFDKLIADGASAGQALAQIGPVIDAFSLQLEETGFIGSEAFTKIKSLAGTASDEIVNKGMTAISGLTDLMKGLHNSGMMDQEMFTGLSNQIGTTFKGLIDQGKNGDEVMRLMQPTLQMLYEAQKKFGYAVDETTQQMMDQAVENGVVGDKYMSTNDRMVQASDRMVTALEGIARKFGVEIPEAVDTMAVRGKAANDVLIASNNALQIQTAANNQQAILDAQIYQSTAGAAVDIVAGKFAGVSTAAANAGRSVQSTSSYFTSWRDNAVNAAREVQEAVDQVSYGSSPGGIKEWIPMLTASKQAFSDLADSGSGDLKRLKNEVDGMSGVKSNSTPTSLAGLANSNSNALSATSGQNGLADAIAQAITYSLNKSDGGKLVVELDGQVLTTAVMKRLPKETRLRGVA